MGIFRFILALFVIVSHCGIKIGEFNPGVIVVTSFYIVSGLSITKLLETKYKLPQQIPSFYSNRTLRIFPLYLFYWLLTGLCLLFVSPASVPDMRNISFSSFLISAFILPGNFSLFLNLERSLALPQAWFLGQQLIFYGIFPWLLIAGQRIIILSNVVSVFIAIGALSGFLHTEYFGYRLFPGVLYMFLFGYYLAKKKYTLILYNYLYVISCVLYIQTNDNYAYFHHYNKEIYLGLFLGVPIVWSLTRLTLPPAWRNYDDFLGKLSYGMFLNHFLIILLLSPYPQLLTNQWSYAGIVITIAIVLAICTYVLIEKPLLGLRRR